MSRTATLRALRALPNIRATFNTEYGEYRVTFGDYPPAAAERVAYYCSDGDDALGTAREMVRRRHARHYRDSRATHVAFLKRHRAALASTSGNPTLPTIMGQPDAPIRREAVIAGVYAARLALAKLRADARAVAA